MMTLSTAVYTAHRGYSWSGIPEGLDEARLDSLLRLATEDRPEFSDGADISVGMVSDGQYAAVYSIRSVMGWDSEGRAADYSALAVFPASAAADINVLDLLRHPFFAVPTREPADSIVYAGPASSDPAVNAPGRLLCQNRIDDLDAYSAGKLLATYAMRCPRWLFRFNEDGRTMSVETAPWNVNRSANAAR